MLEMERSIHLNARRRAICLLRLGALTELELRFNGGRWHLASQLTVLWGRMPAIALRVT